MTVDLTELTRRADSGADLAASALHLAALFKPTLDPSATLAELDGFAAAVRARLPAGAPDARVATVLADYLFDELRFAGNSEDYENPANSFLDEVVTRRRGIPITLSVLYIAVGERLGLAVEGIGFPAHFLLRLKSERGVWILDAFHGGRVLGNAELNRRLRAVFGEAAPTVESHPALLRPASRREILARMLRNLKAIYWQRRDPVNAMTAVEAILALLPDEAEEIRDRGLLYRELGHTAAARADLQRYLEAATDAREAAEIQALLEGMDDRPKRIH